MGCGPLVGFMDNAVFRSAARDIAIGIKALGCFSSCVP
jgi:hypothetical protein